VDTAYYVIFAIFGFFAVLRLITWISGKLKKGKTVPPFAGEIGRRIQSGERLLLYFYTPSCGACKTMTPVIDEMRQKSKNVYKVNLARENERKIGQAFGVMGTPATVIVQNARIEDFMLGARSRKFLNALSV